MTTLHYLVTISEVFAGFNLIIIRASGVVNCLIMCQNTRKMHHSEAKIQKFSPDPSHWGEGHLLPKSHPLGACETSIPAPKRKSWICQ